MSPLLWLWALPGLVGLLAGAHAEQDDDLESCFLQTDQLVSKRQENATTSGNGMASLMSPDILEYAAPRDSLRQEAAAAKEISTGTMVGIGAALLVAMIVINYMLGQHSSEDVSKDIARDDRAPQTWRAFMATMLLSMYLLNYADRYNISVAILELADERGYSKKMQGLIQSAVYIGLIPSAPCMGYFASPEVCGSHRTLVVGCIFWSLCTILTPICGDTSLALLILIRIGLGVGESAGGTCLYQLSANWFPKHQQARSTAMGVAGQCLGAAIAMTFSSITEKDWRIMFYVFGSVGMLWSLVFAVYGSDSAETHRFISEEERMSIEMVRRHEPPKQPPLPVWEILRHRRVQGLLFLEITLCFTWYLWLSWMPSFFHDNFGMSTGEAGTMGLIAYWLAAPASLLWAELSGQCLRSNRWTLRQSRLMMAAVSSVVSSVPMLLLLLVYEHVPAELSVALVVMIVVTMAAKGSGSAANVVDIGGLSNTARVGGLMALFSACIGAVGNVIVGFLLNNPQLGWPSVLLLGAVAGICGYAVFASCLQVQPLSPTSSLTD